MSDLQTCLALFAVVAGAETQHGVASAEKHIDGYVTAFRENPRSALLKLRSAFEDMRLDGHVARHIYASIDRRLVSLD